MLKLLGLFLLALVATGAVLAGQSVGPVTMPDFLAERALQEPPRLAPARLAAPLARLPAAAVGARDQLAALERWNAAGRRPQKNGFSRLLPLPQTVRLDGPPPAAGGGSRDGGVLGRSASGELVWGTRVDVDGAYRLRLHLTAVRLPAAAKIWVYGAGEVRGPFGTELVGPAGDLWTPSVAGGALWIEVALPAASPPRSGDGFVVTDVLEMVGPPAGRLVTQPQAISSSCLIDEDCVTSGTFAGIAQYRGAVASLDFVEGGQGFLCSGGLLNDSKSDFVPYLLTADHCISTQAVAATLDAVWDYYDSACRGTFPDRSRLPASHGATLLATSLQSDFTLLRLTSVPGGRTFLGWNASPGAVVNGTPLFRLSHPAPGGFPFPQSFSTSTADYVSPFLCDDSTGRPINDLTKFIHSVPATGAALPGSSGAPVVLANGQVVGQLLGGCGANVDDPCVAGNQLDQLDGAFAATYPAIAAFLSPAGGTTAQCVPSATTLCLDDAPGDRRFKVQVSFQTTQGGGSSGPGNAIALGGLGVNDGGLFWFFNATNPEMLVKVLNACAAGNHYWVFYAAATNVGLTTTVTDTVTGNSRVYTNADRTAAVPVQDTSALPCS